MCVYAHEECKSGRISFANIVSSEKTLLFFCQLAIESSEDDHANFLRKKKNKNPADYRPDILHQVS